MDYELEMDRIVNHIKDKSVKRVLIQLPDGLKPYAKQITDELRKKTDSEVFIWMGSAYGACDTPPTLDGFKIDLLIQWGHSSWK